jgi:3-phosphoshikimate 1-carboxyvinyltransferase
VTEEHGDTIAIAGGRPLAGTVSTPGDKSISHRALLIGALAEGTSTIRGLSDGDDVQRTASALAALGTSVQADDVSVVIDGGRGRLHQAPPIDLGNSGTSMRLLAGLASGLPWTTTLSGDASLSSRPMDRVAEPLSAMGATLVGRGPTQLPPLAIQGAALHGIDWAPPMASAQVKSAILFAGLDATGETVVREAVATRTHTEEMLAAAGASIDVEPWGTGRLVRIRASTLHPIDLDIPGDPSQAAFWVVAACVIPGSRILVEHVYAGAERIGFMKVLERMGASVSIQGEDGQTANLSAAYSALRGTDVDSSEIPSLDEVPILAVAAAAASGTTTFRNVGELTVKETDRLAATIALVQAIGGQAWATGDDLAVEGGGTLGPRPVAFHSQGDHRLAMAAIVAALADPAGGVVGGVRSVDTSYPGFLAHLDALAGPGAWSPGALDEPGTDGAE